jgi:hypothetical protein
VEVLGLVALANRAPISGHRVVPGSCLRRQGPPCQPAGPEAKPEHGPITLTRAVPCHWPARPFMTSRPEARFISQKTPLSVSDQFGSNSTKISDYRIRSSELKFRI